MGWPSALLDFWLHLVDIGTDFPSQGDFYPLSCVYYSSSLSSYLAKLAKVKDVSRNISKNSVVAFIIGPKIDFNRAISKLRNDWKNINGEMSFTEHLFGWFEITFFNPIDLGGYALPYL